MRLQLQTIDRWTRASCYEISIQQTTEKEAYLEQPSNPQLNPGFAALTAQLRLSICVRVVSNTVVELICSGIRENSPGAEFS